MLSTCCGRELRQEVYLKKCGIFLSKKIVRKQKLKSKMFCKLILIMWNRVHRLLRIQMGLTHNADWFIVRWERLPNREAPASLRFLQSLGNNPYHLRSKIGAEPGRFDPVGPVKTLMLFICTSGVACPIYVIVGLPIETALAKDLFCHPLESWEHIRQNWGLPPSSQW